MSRRSRARSRGFTLVEVLIAASLGLLILGAIVGVFVSNSRNYKQNDALAALQDNARFALDVLGRDLTMAGYMGGIRPLDAVYNVRRSGTLATSVPTNAVSQCAPAGAPANWLFDVSTPVVFSNHLAGGGSNFGCLTGAFAPAANSDALLVRRVAGQPALSLTAMATAKLIPHRIYLISNGNIGSLYQWPGTGSLALGQQADCRDPDGNNAACPPEDYPVSYYAYTPHIYYVQANGNNPRLCRRTLPREPTAAAQTMEDECLADGIENFQIEWGLDSDGDINKTVDRYVSAPTPGQLENAQTARIHVIVRSTETNVGLSGDTKAITVADYNTETPAKTSFIRRLYTTTVQLKNNKL